MRDYKFRGKRKDNGEWVYGELHILTARVPHIHTDICSRTKIDVNTIGQYTGLKDRHGKEIWEGDVVRSISDWGDFGKIGEVVFINGKFMLDTHDDSFGGKYRYKDFVEKEEWEDFKARMEVRFEYEVIGNVIDNKELLNKKQ